MSGFDQVPEETIKLWLGRLFNSEGGFTLNKFDNGNWTGGRMNAGELKGTKYGISAGSYPRLDIKNLTIEQAANIYRQDFLQPIGAGRFRDGVGFQLFDLAVNSGPGRALRLVQKAVGVRADGVVGPLTLAAIKNLSETDVIMAVTAERIDFMRGLSSWGEFGAGWMGRIADNLRYGAADS